MDGPSVALDVAVDVSEAVEVDVEVVEVAL